MDNKGIMKGAMLGVLSGLVIAGVGAWKDTLYEPFEFSKFMRSPVICGIAGAIVGGVAPNLGAIPMASTAIVMERITVEGWKALGRKPPGKFKMEGRDSGWLYRRLSGEESVSEYDDSWKYV